MSIPAYLYSRFSTPEQADGDSERRQLDRAERYCDQHGLSLITRFHDAGVSSWQGRNRKVGALSRFLEGLRDGRVDGNCYLLIEDLDRLTREPMMSAIRLVGDILAYGVRIVTLNDNHVITETELNKNGFHAMMLVTKIATNNGESNKKSDRSRANFAQKRVKAAQGVPFSKNGPGWLEWSPERGKLWPHPIHTQAVQRCFELAAEGNSSLIIARTLTAEGYKPFGGSESWRTGYISKLLRNDAVLGTFRPNRVVEGDRREPTGDVIEGYYEPVITADLFFRAQAARRPRNSANSDKGRTYENLFSRIGQCVVCGQPMSLGTVKQKNKIYRYLVCEGKKLRKARGNGEVCDLPNFKYDYVEKLILSHVAHIDVAKALPPTAEDRGLKRIAEEIGRAEYDLTGLSRKRDALLDDLESLPASARSAVLERIGKRSEEIATQEAVLATKRAERDKLARQNEKRTSGPDVVRELEAQIERTIDPDSRALLRSRLSIAVKAVVDMVRFAPDGSFEAVLFRGRLAQHFPAQGPGIAIMAGTELPPPPAGRKEGWVDQFRAWDAHRAGE